MNLSQIESCKQYLNIVLVITKLQKIKRVDWITIMIELLKL